MKDTDSMNQSPKFAHAKYLRVAALLLFTLATIGMASRFEPFYSGYYSFAWWSYILFAQSFLHLKGGKSLLFERPRKFLLMLPISVTVWLIFEAVNFRLSNWHYVEIPASTFARWVGYPVAYSTVLPGIFSTAALLDYFGAFKNSTLSPLSRPEKLYKPFYCIGALFLILPLIGPQYFFPLIWGAFIFLLEPINHKNGAPSLLRAWEKGSLRKFYILMLSGALCGLLWELWNFWAGAKWIYTVPYVGGLKVFEMPLLGFLGFPPFAVECFTMTASIFLLIRGIGERCSRKEALGYYALGVCLVVMFDLFVFAGIDRFTILSFQDIGFLPFGLKH